MSRVQRMTWVESTRRWKKMYRGKVYTISCRELGCQPFKMASLPLANQWWEQKRKEIDLDVQYKNQTLKVAFNKLMQDELRRTIQDISEHGELLKILYDKDTSELQPSIEETVGKTSKLLDHVAEDVPTDRTIGHLFTNFKKREMARAERKDVSVSQASVNVQALEKFITFAKWNTDVGTIDETVVSDYHEYLNSDQSKGSETKRKAWTVFKRFLRECREDKLLTLPENLESKRFAFKRAKKKIVTWSVQDIRTLLAKIPDDSPAKAWYLLMLNCGFRDRDVSEVVESEINWTKGTLTRKRLKTSEDDSCPVVCYPLWQETIDAIRRHRSGQERVFLGADGLPLWDDKIVDGKRKKVDRIRKEMDKWIKEASIKGNMLKLRATCASTLDEHAEYGRYSPYYLGHSPGTMATAHYIQPSYSQFKLALDWLKTQLLG